jgi:hypothetical protein
MEAIRRRVGRDGKKVAAGLVAIALGDAAARRAVFKENFKVGAKERITALVALAKLGGWGDATEDRDGGGLTINVMVPSVVSEDQWRALSLPPSDTEIR